MLLLMFIASTLVWASPEDTLKKGCQKFAPKFYKEVSDTTQNQNFVVSPFPVQTLLAAIVSAAVSFNGNTVTEIRNALELPSTKQEMNQAFGAILPKFNKSNDDFKMFDVVKFYIAHHYSIKNHYRTLLKTVYGANIDTINFKSIGASNEINKWVSQNTNGKINDFLQLGDISTNTKNLLLNALYLQGKWSSPFDIINNELRTFHGIDKSLAVEMMVNKRSFYYGEDSRAKYLKMEILREGGGADMLFVLPKANLSQIEDHIGEVFTFKEFRLYQVQVVVPRFNITSDVKLRRVLEKLGVHKLFKFGIELDGLKSSGHPLLMVTSAFQKSILEVNEWGVTVASAQSIATFVDDPVLEEKEFIADRPFIFQIIVDGLVLFAGRVIEVKGLD